LWWRNETIELARGKLARLNLLLHLMASVDVKSTDLTALAVTTGPGSFTGVRTAVSAAEGDWCLTFFPSKRVNISAAMSCACRLPQWFVKFHQLPGKSYSTGNLQSTAELL
jgi:hypothetical protein